MTRLATLFTCSFRRLKEVRTVTVCAMLGAIAIVLGSLSIDLGPSVRIGFSGIPNELVHYLFGPAVGSLFAGALDILKYMIKPVGGFFPGFTLVAMLAGVIYGVFLYGKKPTLLRVVATKATINIVINAFLATLWMALLGGKGFYAMIPVRVIKNLAMIPIESAILYAVLNAASQALRRAGYYKIRK